MIKIIFLIVFIFLGATFSTLNREEISLRYFFGWSTGPFPIFILVLSALVIGMIVGYSVGWGERRKLGIKARDFGSQVKALKEEIEPLIMKEESLEPSGKRHESEETPPG
jgi:uncharacterized integral membrane protein